MATQGCVSNQEYFAFNVQAKVLTEVCTACHNPTGVANTTKFVLHSSAEAGYLDANMAIVKNEAQTEQNQVSVLLQKPLGQLNHGGGKVLDEGSPEYAALKEMVDRFNSPDDCPTNTAEFFAGAQLAGPADTLRKATLTLAARLPTAAEQASVDKGGFTALDTILDELMTEQPFYDRLMESYNDRFFTDFYMDPQNDPLQLIQPDPMNPATQYYSPMWFDSIAHEDQNSNTVTVQNPQDLVKYGASRRMIFATSSSRARSKPSPKSRSS